MIRLIAEVYKVGQLIRPRYGTEMKIIVIAIGCSQVVTCAENWSMFIGHS
jgi:hypothetical protein